MSYNQKPTQFRIACGNGGCFGPALRPVLTEEIGEVSFLPDTRYLLLKLQSPTLYQTDSIEYLLVTPRYAGISLEDLRARGGTVGIARVLPHVVVDPSKGFTKDEIEYFAIGDCTLVEAE